MALLDKFYQKVYKTKRNTYSAILHETYIFSIRELSVIYDFGHGVRTLERVSEL